MNPHPTSEGAWASYFKTAAWILPALFVWMGAVVFVIPKLKELAAGMNLLLPKGILAALVLSDMVKNNFAVLAVVAAGGLALLEWRAGWWPRCRRAVFGGVAFALNLGSLAFLAAMLLFATYLASQMHAAAHTAAR